MCFLQKPLPFEFQAQGVSVTSCHLAGQGPALLPAGPAPRPLSPCPAGEDLEGPGNGTTSHSVGLGAHGCREDRSDARQRKPLSGSKEGRGTGHRGTRRHSFAQTLPGMASCPEKLPFLFPAVSSRHLSWDPLFRIWLPSLFLGATSTPVPPAWPACVFQVSLRAWWSKGPGGPWYVADRLKPCAAS